MKIAVRYYSKSGNTKKLAEAIASLMGVEALDISHKLNEKVDLLFLGSAIYAAGIDESVKKFIASLSPDRVGQVINFSTAALLSSSFYQVKKLVESQGISMSEREFHCRGRFHFIHKNKPDAEDIDAVKRFAISFVK